MRPRSLWPRLKWSVVPMLVVALAFTRSQAQGDDLEARKQLAAEAYVYGYPLVLMAVTRSVMTNVEAPSDRGAPENQLGHARVLVTPETKHVVRPSPDTLDSFAWLDLSSEPLMFRLPAMGERFATIQVVDAYGQVFSSPDLRTVSEEQLFAIVGPAGTEALPEGATRIDAPTNSVLLVVRVRASAGSDLAEVHGLQNAMRLVPLSGWLTRSEPIVDGEVDPDIDMQTPPAEQVAQMNSGAFFHTMSEALTANPPPSNEVTYLDRFAEMGLRPGEPFDVSTLDPDTTRAVQAGVDEGERRIAIASTRLGERENGWRVMRETDRDGSERFLHRAAIAAAALGSPLPRDRLTMLRDRDHDGLTLEGRRSYVLRFPKGALPPSDAGWSLTVYDEEGYLVGNALDRYFLGDQSNLEISHDGAVELVIQHDPPFSGDYRNWLPAPLGKFTLVLRLDWPKEAALTGAWKPQPLVRTH